MGTKMYDGDYEAWCVARDKADQEFREANPQTETPRMSERPTLIPTGNEDDLPY